MTIACGVGTLFIGRAGDLQYMLHHDLFPGGGAMLVGFVLIFCVGINLIWGKRTVWQTCCFR